jgi:hypothetical protein
MPFRKIPVFVTCPVVVYVAPKSDSGELEWRRRRRCLGPGYRVRIVMLLRCYRTL